MPVEYTAPPSYQAVADPVTGYALNQFDWSVVVPEGTQNYFSNPSFEDSDIAFVELGANTVARVTTIPNSAPVFGLYALRVTPSNTAGTTQIRLRANGVLPAGPVSFSLFFLGTAGEQFYLAAANNTAGSGNVPQRVFTATGLWQRIVLPTQTAYLDVATAPTGVYVAVGKLTRTLNPYYLDGLQLEPKPYATTYCDGTQPGCAWVGPISASFSYRLDNAGGGREYRLSDLGFQVLSVSGHDAPPYEAQVQTYGLVGGQQYQRTVPRPQVITLSNVIEGTTSVVTRQTKDKIIGLLAPFSSQYQDRHLILRGKQIDDCRKFAPVQTGPTLELAVRVAGDLSGINDNYNQERFALSFVSDNPPSVAAVYEKGLVLNPSSVLAGTTGNMTYYKPVTAQPSILANIPNQWKTPWYTAVAPATQNFRLTALAVCNKGIPLSGLSPSSVYGARYDGTNGLIVALPDAGDNIGGSLNNVVNALAFDQNGILYAGGNWTTGAFSPPAYIARNNGTALAAIGTTNVPNAQVRALVAVPYQSVVYAFGDFTNSGTRWGVIGIVGSGDNTWDNPTGGAGFNGTVQGAILLQNGKILIYGDFTSVDGVARNRVVIYDPYSGAGTFSGVASGFTNGSVRSAVQLPNGDIVFGGTFTLTGTGLTANFVAIYNGSQILPLGNNILGGQVNSVAYFQGAVYAAGVYVTVPDAVGRNQVCYGLVVLVGDYWVTPDIFTLFDGTGAGGTFVGTGGGALYASSSASLGAAFAAAVGAVSYDGTADAYPTIMIKATGQSTLFSIVNQVSGAAIYFNNLIIATNETVTIECAPTGLTATSNLYGDVSRFIMGNSDFSGFSLVKRNTSEAATADYTNQVAVLASLTGTIELYWRTTFQGFSAASTAAMSGL